jgi:elongation factor Ts
MANFTAKDVADLRARTGVGMMDCKNALSEADGDMEKAAVLLREKGLATQASKSGRIAAEGLVYAIVENGVGAVVEVNSETDFVAQNREFKDFVLSVAKTVIAANPSDMDELLKSKAVGGKGTVEEDLQELFFKIRENLKVRRFKRLEGILTPYIHGDGKIGVIVKFESDVSPDNAELLECGKNIALQVASMNARYLDRAAVPASVIEDEKKIMLSQMADDPKMKGKPEQVLGKIVEGKIGKFYTENCLIEQAYVKDGDLSVQKYVDAVSKSIGGSVKIADFVRYEKGEGIEKKKDDFASEVAELVNK